MGMKTPATVRDLYRGTTGANWGKRGCLSAPPLGGTVAPCTDAENGPGHWGRIDDLARRVERLSPSPRHPERFHEDKSEIIDELYRLAREARR